VVVKVERGNGQLLGPSGTEENVKTFNTYHVHITAGVLLVPSYTLFVFFQGFMLAFRCMTVPTKKTSSILGNTLELILVLASYQ
jgi:hypothetical protein